VARDLLTANRPSDAIQTLLPALSTSPDYAELHCLMAHAHVTLAKPRRSAKGRDARGASRARIGMRSSTQIHTPPDLTAMAYRFQTEL
jgi:hypothetical protein